MFWEVDIALIHVNTHLFNALYVGNNRQIVTFYLGGDNYQIAKSSLIPFYHRLFCSIISPFCNFLLINFDIIQLYKMARTKQVPTKDDVAKATAVPVKSFMVCLLALIPNFPIVISL